MEVRSSPNVWVVMAAYNEARVIADVVADVRTTGHRVVVVDDGSKDSTADVAAGAGAIVIKHPINLGQGAGLLDALARHGADYALGSRFRGSSVNLPPSRRALLRAATWFTRATTGLDITDSHNGLRAMTRRGASRIHLRQNRMAHASEILHQIATSGLKYVETPVTIHYSAYSLAKGQTLFDALLIILDLFARRLHR